MRSMFIWALFCSAAFGGTVEQKTERVEFTTDQLVRLEADSADNGGTLWSSLKPLDLIYETVDSKDGKSVLFFKEPAGEYILNSDFLDFESDRFVKIRWIVTVKKGSKPDDEDEDEDDDEDDETPSPEVPEDPFDNIGRRVAGWADGLATRKDAAKVYRKYSGLFYDASGESINSLTPKFRADLKASTNISHDCFANLNADLKARWDVSPMNRFELAEYFEAIATGLEAE